MTAPGRHTSVVAPARPPLRDVTGMALDSLRAHGVRSLLTTLGVVIGVATVVTMASVIQGFGHIVESSFTAYGSHVIYVRMFRPALFAGGLPDSLRHRHAFTPGDAQAIREQCPDVREVSVMGFVENATLEADGRTLRGLQVIGVDPEIQDVMRYDPARGRFFTREECRRRAQVLVSGADIGAQLYPDGRDPVGRTVRLNGITFTLVGELERKGGGKLSGHDELLTIPFPTLEKYFPPPPDAPFYVPRRGECYLSIAPVSPERTPAALDEIRSVLRARRHVPQDKPDDFALLTEDSFAEIYRRLTGATFAVMLLISSVALVVGGIGVMNVMLVSVTERTHEIGIRRASGATRGVVLAQFLLEAVTLTGLGGLLGIALGAAGAQAVRALSPLPAWTPPWSVAVAFVFSLAVGLFFGLYPAMRAARLDPAEALRWE